MGVVVLTTCDRTLQPTELVLHLSESEFLPVSNNEDLSIRNWENLTRERGWSVAHYVDRMRDLTRRVFVNVSDEP